MHHVTRRQSPGVWLLALSLCAGACVTAPTPYQSMRRNGGFTNTRFDSASFQVLVEVNKHTRPEIAELYMRRRALEVCREQGFADFLVLDDNRSFRRTIRWTGLMQGELGYRTRVIAQVRCTNARQQKG
jgi:hypothetical protein